ncbi:DNA primase DnaG [Halovenus marina]|uniref:DNA primase DnaG n=1 Tax=Halovenus marina TaxID=3396621 RepID=UPI003F56B2DB
MQDTPKYLIHADIRTSGVVERSDVVGAIFGQTEGLLGDELDLRDLSESSKVGHIDVDIESEGGRSFGTVTVASGLDRVETAVLAAALETIERVGPCRAECTVRDIEDAREAKRRELVDRASELLTAFEETTMTSDELVEEVRQRARVEQVTNFEGLPAGPRVADSDAIIIVEGRADVRRLLEVGIKNVIAVEGTDIPDAVAGLTAGRTVTAFLDGDRGGDLILRELEQVGDVDYVAFAPTGRSVEDLDRAEILAALRRKLPSDQIADGRTPRETFDGSDPVAECESESSPTPAEDDATASEDGVVDAVADERREAPNEESEPAESQNGSASRNGDAPLSDTADAATRSGDESAVSDDDEETETAKDDDASTAADAQEPRAATDGEGATAEVAEAQSGVAADATEDTEGENELTSVAAETSEPQTLAGHVQTVVNESMGTVRLLDADCAALAEGPADSAFDLLSSAEETPQSVVLDGTLDQRLLDVAAQRGVGQFVVADTAEFVKQPVSVRIRTAADLDVEA